MTSALPSTAAKMIEKNIKPFKMTTDRSIQLSSLSSPSVAAAIGLTSEDSEDSNVDVAFSWVVKLKAAGPKYEEALLKMMVVAVFVETAMASVLEVVL